MGTQLRGGRDTLPGLGLRAWRPAGWLTITPSPWGLARPLRTHPAFVWKSAAGSYSFFIFCPIRCQPEITRRTEGRKTPRTAGQGAKAGRRAEAQQVAGNSAEGAAKTWKAGSGRVVMLVGGSPLGLQVLGGAGMQTSPGQPEVWAHRPSGSG